MLFGLAIFGFCSAATVLAANPTLLNTASADIYSSTNYGTTRLGTVLLQQFREQGPSGDVAYVQITGNLQSIYPSAPHGFHVHETAPVAPTGCTALGKHYNPYSVDHGSPSGTTQSRHVGDLGNVNSDQTGNVALNFRDTIIQIGTHDVTFDIVGKAIAVHVGTDDLGLGGTNVSKTTGNAGTIMACGAIVLQNSNLASTASPFTPLQSLMTTVEVLLLLALLF